MTDPDQLKRQRGGHRSVATQRIKEAKDAFANPTSVDTLRLEQLKRGLKETYERLNKLRGYYATY